MKNTSKILLAILIVTMLAVSVFAITSSAADTTTVYVKNDRNWSTVNVYWWGSSTGCSGMGVAMTLDSETGLYKGEVPSDATGFLFNNGNWSGTNQTGDLTLNGVDGMVYSNKNAGTFTVAGDNTTMLGTSWDVSNKANDLTYDVETGLFTKVYWGAPKTTLKFKIALNHSWGTSWPGSDKSLSIPANNCKVVITFNSNTAAVGATAYGHSYEYGVCECGDVNVTGLSGEGTEASPYLIHNVHELTFFRDSVNAGETTYNAEGVYVALDADIDLAGIDWSVNIGDDCNYTFDGIFDGKGHKISNLTATETAKKADGYVCGGLFGAIYGSAQIKNLTIENVNIDATYTGNNVGALVGFAYACTGSIENVTICGDININASGVYGVGAIVGYSYNGNGFEINNCKVTANEGSNIIASAGAGAIIGYNNGTDVNGSEVSNLSITAQSIVGGISGTTLNASFDNVSVINVTLSATHENWLNSTGIVAGSIANNAIAISNCNYENVTGASRAIGSEYTEKPSAPVAAIVANANGKYYTSIADAIAAAEAGNTVTIYAGTYAVPSMKAGITIVGEGNVLLEGTLSGTLENLTLKNLHIKGANAQRWAYAKGDLVFENVTFEATSIYALHFDGITAGATLLYKDCTIIGWAAMSGSPASCEFIGCTIKGNGSYGVIRTYFDATIEDCTFDVSNTNPDDVYQDGIHSVAATVTVNNCTNANGEMTDIVHTSNGSEDAGFVVVDGVEIHSHTFTAGEAVAPGCTTVGYTPYSCVCGEVENRDEVDALGHLDTGLDAKCDTCGKFFVPDGPFKLEVYQAKKGGTYYFKGSMSGYYFATTSQNSLSGAVDVYAEKVDGGYYLYFMSGTTKNYLYIQINGTYTNIKYGSTKAVWAFNESFGTFTTVVNGTTYYMGSYSNYVTISASKISYLSTSNMDKSQFPARPVSLEDHVCAEFTTKVTAPKCTTQGYTTKTCKACGVATKVDYVDALGHNLVDVEAKAPTFDATGYTAHKDCSRCTYTEGKEILPKVVVVAKIGDERYASFAEAFDAAVSGDTILLCEDIDIDSVTFTIPDGKSLTLDMGGNKITVTDNKTSNYELFYIYGELTVTGDGTIELTSTNNRAWNAMSAIFHNRGGVLTIENGTYSNLGGTDMAWVVDNSGNYYGDATTNINGGTLISTYTAIRNRMEQNSHGASGTAILNVKGGTINGTTSAIWAQAASTSATAPATGVINIEGGDIGLINTARSAGAECMTTLTGGTVAGFKGEVGELTVNGGTITGDILVYTASGEAVPHISFNEDGVVISVVAKIGEVYYETVSEAIEAAVDGDVITLLSGTISEEIKHSDLKNRFGGKNITIEGSEEGTTLTGGLYIGYDDNNPYTGSVIVKNITFEGAGLSLVQLDSVSVIDCKFNNITKNAIFVAADSATASITITGNVIDGAEMGIRIRNALAALVDGNEISNTQHNGILFEQGSAHNANTYPITITNNTLKNWGLSGEGRAIRVALGKVAMTRSGSASEAKNVNISNNILVNENAPEEFLKMTDVDASMNVVIEDNVFSGTVPAGKEVVLLEGSGAADVDTSDNAAVVENMPHIKDGNWWIGSTDTGVKAEAVDGHTPVITIVNGNWYIDGEDTGVKAEAVDGVDGETPYIKDGNWWIGDKDLGVKAEGVDGVDGETPYIKDGNWWIGDKDLGVKAEGVDGKTPVIEIIDGYWYINGEKTDVKALAVDGVDGQTPYIKDGNWWIGDKDLGVKAEGVDGHTPVITIVDGYWYIDGVNQNVKAEAVDGKTPTVEIVDGKWIINGEDCGWAIITVVKVELTKSEGLVDTYTVTLSDGTTYTFTVTNGKDGVDGEDGKDGIDGKPGQDGEDGKDGADGNDNNIFVGYAIGIAALSIILALAVILYRGVKRRSWWSTR